MKIKAIPIKSRTLCEKCYFFVFGEYCEKTKCKDCENKGESQCHCTEIVMGEPCRYFKRRQDYVELSNDAIRFVDKNGVVVAEFKQLENGNIRITHCESGADNGK